MKIYLLFFLLSCGPQNDLRVGECVQKADSNQTYKILEIRTEKNTARAIDNDQKISEINLKEDWIKTICL